ncbi:MAG: N-6 DNA methylase, partial [Vulcanisaeta sp.]
MDVKRHENVRIMVVNEIKEIVKELLDEKIRISKGSDVKASILRSLIEKSEFLPLITPQEVRVGEERRFIDMGFSNTIAFEFKSDESEFNEGVEKAKREYLPKFPSVKYYVITNWDKWRIYEVKRQGNYVDLQLIMEGSKQKAIELLRQIISQIPEFKIIPLPENISKLFSLDVGEYVEKLKDIFIKVKENPDVKPLYETYSKIIKMLYSNASEDVIVDLFIKHTIMHMIALASLTSALEKVASPVDAVSGAALEVDIALPYLNWWRMIYDEYRQDIDDIINDITIRASMIDWKLGGTEDVFRVLYEVLVEPEMRKRLGEYYTPIWLVELILNEFDLKNKLVLDPFCGSGTFLVMAFHRKVNDYREDPDDAINELVGFDVNPLAVAIARAELILAYRRYKPNLKRLPLPHIYHVDTLGMLFGAPLEYPDPDVKKLMLNIRNYVELVLKMFNADKYSKMSVIEVIKALSTIEENITMAIKLAI